MLQAESSQIPALRLLDPSVLSPTYQQRQQIRGYYQFPEQLDIDRYKNPTTGKTQDTVVAVREMGVPLDQRNWINDHLVYTHGFGFVAAPGNAVDGSGVPNLQRAGHPADPDASASTSRRIYFGENSPEYSIVGAPRRRPRRRARLPRAGHQRAEEQHLQRQRRRADRRRLHPVPLRLKYGETNLLLNSSINDESRIMYIRKPIERIQAVAPFLTLDRDPYPAVVDGRIQWIVDAYTTSDAYPYAEPRSLGDPHDRR